GGGGLLLFGGPKQTREFRLVLKCESRQGKASARLRFSHSSDDNLVLTPEGLRLPQTLKGKTAAREMEYRERPQKHPSKIAAVRIASEHYFASWRTFHFHDTSRGAAIKQLRDLEDNRFLRDDGANLAPFLYLLKHKHAAEYERIRDTVRLAAPFFDD